MKQTIKCVYETPEVNVVNIEIEQSILSSSIENLGDILPDKDWE